MGKNKKIFNQQNFTIPYIKFLKKLDIDTQFKAVATSDSMYPTIKAGDMLTIVKIPFRSLTTGSIAAFISPDKQHIVVHRIIELNYLRGRVCRTKGDYNPRPDPWVFSNRDYIGAVISIPKKKNLSSVFCNLYKFLTDVLRKKFLNFFLYGSGQLFM